MKVSLDISVPSSLWRGLPRARAIARETIAAAAAEIGAVRIDRPEGRASFQTPYWVEVSLCLTDDAALRALNSRWRGIDKPTNVLSFPSSSAGGLGDATTLGDIALAYETLAREAESLGVPLADHYRHLLAHGFLHLIGYDHETDAEAERMEALETRILARLGAADPYAREFIGG
jgi:probable rRNA maturation factor